MTDGHVKSKFVSVLCAMVNFTHSVLQYLMYVTQSCMQLVLGTVVI